MVRLKEISNLYNWWINSPVFANGSKIWESSPEKPLKENLGHTRLQVVIGSILGPTIALPGLVFIGSPLHLAKIIMSSIA